MGKKKPIKERFHGEKRTEYRSYLLQTLFASKCSKSTMTTLKQLPDFAVLQETLRRLLKNIYNTF